MTPDGMKAVSVLAKEGIKTNVTLIFSANQALVAARAGATYVSPFIGRLDDIGQTGLNLFLKSKKSFLSMEFRHKLLQPPFVIRNM